MGPVTAHGSRRHLSGYGQNVFSEHHFHCRFLHLLSGRGQALRLASSRTPGADISAPRAQEEGIMNQDTFYFVLTLLWVAIVLGSLMTIAE
jgi:hypothetical protein